MSFDGKTVVITGANGSLGRVVAQAFLAEGAKLELLDIDFADDARPSPGDNVTRHKVDLLDGAATDAVFKKIGKLDVLCNIAGGFGMGTPVHETTENDWDKQYDLNVRTLLNASRAAVPAMKNQGRGAIINMGAAAAAGAGVALMGPYLSAKGTVLKITETMSEELKKDGINVNCVMPSVIDTPPNREAMADADFSEWVSPQQLAAVITFLASDAAEAVHGACIPVKNLA